MTASQNADDTFGNRIEIETGAIGCDDDEADRRETATPPNRATNTQPEER